MKNSFAAAPSVFFKDEMAARFPIAFLNIAQLLSAFADNYLRFLTVFFLIKLAGPAQASSVTATAGILYVTPFLLFSSYAGMIADRFSKQKWIVFLKGCEVFVALFAVIAFYLQSTFGCYFCLFLMATQSSFFSPTKGSIVVELVGKEGLARANGILVASSYLAIIAGSSLVAFLAENLQSFWLTAFILFLITLLGFASSLFIPKTAAGGVRHKARTFFLADVVQTLRLCRKTPNLLLSILGGCSFILMASFFQLNLIPYAIDTLKASEYVGCYLLFATSIGIVGGSYIAGRLSKKEIDLGLSAIASLVLSLLLLSLPLFSKTPWTAATLFVFIGFFAGMYSLPFEAYTQAVSSSDKIGKIVGTSNFLQFSCVALSTGVMFLLNNIFGFSPLQSFLCIACLTLVLSAFFMQRLSSYLFCLVAKTIFMPFHKVSYIDLPNAGSCIMLSKKLPWPILFTLCASSPHTQLVLCKSKLKWSDRVLALLSNVVIVRGGHELRKMKRVLYKGQEKVICIFDHPLMYQHIRARLEDRRGDFAAFPLYHIQVQRAEHESVSLKNKRAVSITFYPIRELPQAS